MSGQASEMLNAYTNALERPLDWSTDMSQAEFDRLTEEWKTYSLLSDAELQPQTPTRGHPQRPFQSLLFDCRPDVLKRHRLHAGVMMAGSGLGEPMPRTSPIWTIVSGHWYTTTGDAVLAMVDIAAARTRGATKAEVSHWLALASFSGHNWFNAAGRIVEPYMRAWDADDGAPGLQWPEGWRADPDVFRSGIDFTDFDESRADEELELIRDWYRRWQGEVPAFVDFFGKHFPLVLRAFRARYETVMDGALPCQMVALLQLDLAAKWTQPDAVRRLLHMAKALGATKDQVVQVLAFTQNRLGDTRMNAALPGVDDILDDWDTRTGAA
jgi:alkylhydroperoxidase/carboxymuconolactone decarboxylase family protein YurZ